MLHDRLYILGKYYLIIIEVSVSVMSVKIFRNLPGVILAEWSWSDNRVKLLLMYRNFKALYVWLVLYKLFFYTFCIWISVCNVYTKQVVVLSLHPVIVLQCMCIVIHEKANMVVCHSFLLSCGYDELLFAYVLHVF